MRTILRRKDTGFPPTTVYGWQSVGLYPRFFRYGPKASGVFEDEHDRVMNLRSGNATEDQVRDLVDRIHQERKLAAQNELRR